MEQGKQGVTKIWINLLKYLRFHISTCEQSCCASPFVPGFVCSVALASLVSQNNGEAVFPLQWFRAGFLKCSHSLWMLCSLWMVSVAMSKCSLGFLLQLVSFKVLPIQQSFLIIEFSFDWRIWFSMTCLSLQVKE